MRRFTTLLVVTIISAICFIAKSEVITKEIAHETANTFLALDNEWHGATDAQVQLVEKDGIPAYYIVEYTAGGWAIVSAQSSSSPIIGYNTTSQYAAPGAMRELLDFNARIITARAKDLGNTEHIGWQRVRQRKATAESIINTTPDIEPLIKINLNQSSPFNTYCPKIDGKQTIVGCVAVGMTQAMMVQGYPQRAMGSYSYTSAFTGTHSINYDAEAAYNWDAIYACEETGNYDEIARMLYHAGVSVEMQYGLDASGTQTQYVANALVRNFGYNNKIVKFVSKTPNDNEWLELLLNELTHGRAVVYSGQAVEGGHCWNIDGWKQATQMLHCNWGWAGYGNGYFSLNNMTDSYQSINFLYDHGAVFGVQAPSSAPYDILLKDTQFAIGTPAGTSLTYIEVLSTEKSASYNYELYGPNNTISPYQISGNRLVSSEAIANSDKFHYLRIKATNKSTGESYEKIFNISTVSSNMHKILGTYNAYANSAFAGYPDSEWKIEIVADKYDNTKVWLQPICIFGGLESEEIYRIYATYNEAKNTLTMPLGQVLYETPHYKLICASSNGNNIDITSDITLQVEQSQSATQITFAQDYVFGVGDILHEDGWWYQALYNISLTKNTESTTKPLGITLSNTTLAIGLDAYIELADVNVICEENNETFYFDVYDSRGETSPYQVINNKLVSSATIANSDNFKYARIVATNTVTGESCEEEFTFTLIETVAMEDLLGNYNAFAHSAFKDRPDEEWAVSITADRDIPNKLWIHPICIFGGLEASSIGAIYATYNAVDGTLSLPLGQILYERNDKYQMLIGASADNGETIHTNGELILQLSKENDAAVISFGSNIIVGVGNAIGNEWWYQALYGITFTQIEKSVVEKVDISKLAGNYNAFAHSAFKDYPDEEWEVSISIDQESPNKVWIKPVCMFADLNPRYINAVYATYDAETGILTMPLGQVLYEQDDKYRIITGASFDGGASLDTSGDIRFYVTLKDENVVIEMDSNAVIGVGNAMTNQWWWQALYAMTYTKVRVYEKIEIDGIYYNITSDAKRTAQVSFKGNSHDQYSNEYIDDVVIPETIHYDGKTFTVTSIDEGSFYYCTRVTSITIPGTITEIGDKAFYNCVSLSQINMGAVNPPLIYAETFMGVNKSIPVHVPDNSKPYYVSAQYWNEFTNIVDNAAPIESGKIEVNGVFYNITGANTAEVTYKGNSYDEYSNEYSGAVVIPETISYNGTTYTVTAIGDKTFVGCHGLTSVAIGNNVSSIGEYAFYGCSNLTNITWPSGALTIKNQAFRGSGLREVTIRANMQLGYTVFYECTSLASVAIEEGTTTIPEWTFGYCNSITDINIPSTVANIENFALYSCNSLASITIPANVTSIGQSAIALCSSLESIVVEPENGAYDSRGNCNALIETATNTLLVGCQNTVIPKDIVSIASEAFAHSTALTSIVIPEGVASIGYGAFNNCTALTSVSIPSTITEIGEAAFYDCTAITELYAFATNAPTIYEQTFGNVDKNIPVYVPDGCVEVYRTADYWQEFTNFNVYSGIEVAISESDIDVTIINGTITLTGVANDAVVHIYSLSGSLVQQTIASNVSTIVLPRGIYIVQVEGTSHKVVI